MSPILLGIRHHGPGSARAVRRALSAYQPEVVLIEGPPEADPLVPLAGEDGLRAPVALLAYPAGSKPGSPGRPGRDRDAGRTPATFWPFGEFSPEWQALRWATASEVPVRFIDLPAAVGLAAGGEPQPDERPQRGEDDELRADPIGVLAAAAGYDDPERWWEDVVEHRSDQDQRAAGAKLAAGAERTADATLAAVAELAAALDPFAAIAEAMTEVRAQAPEPPEPERSHQERREAAMRSGLRTALRQYERVAVVCGAWHVPALALVGGGGRTRGPLPTATADAQLLRGLPKLKVTMTWVPWTHTRLASGRGYAAGVRSPGWYHHLFTTPPAETVSRWLVRAAAVLRRDDLPVSSAHVIEATRLADTLATLRGRPVPGLAEVTDAALAVLCEGDPLRLELIQRRLVVGERLGAVPERAPAVPIARDVAAAQRRLRLPPQPEPRELDLDLRREIDLERSRLLHRLQLLGVEWGVALRRRRGRGTFWESWRVAWQPEFAVDLVEAGGYGTTVRDAATARVLEQAAAASSLAEITELVERCLLAELPDALPAVLAALDDRMARVGDLAQLMDALPALARTLRYGDVRRTDRTALQGVTDRLVTRICVGLPAGVASLDDAAAAGMRDRIDAVDAAVGLLDDADLTARWQDVLTALSIREELHGLLAGRLNRLLHDAGRLDPAEAGRRLGRVLTVGVPTGRAAAWIEGFLTGDGLLLVHDERLLRLVDGWLTSLPDAAFVEALPLLRRTFSEYPAPQRRQIGQRAVRLGGAGSGPDAGLAEAVDGERAELVMPTVDVLLGRGSQ